MASLELYHFGNKDRAAARQADIVPVRQPIDGKNEPHPGDSTFADFRMFANFTAEDLPRPIGKRIT